VGTNAGGRLQSGQAMPSWADDGFVADEGAFVRQLVQELRPAPLRSLKATSSDFGDLAGAMLIGLRATRRESPVEPNRYFLDQSQHHLHRGQPRLGVVSRGRPVASASVVSVRPQRFCSVHHCLRPPLPGLGCSAAVHGPWVGADAPNRRPAGLSGNRCRFLPLGRRKTRLARVGQA